MNSSRTKNLRWVATGVGAMNIELSTSFSLFFEDWLLCQEHYSELLESAAENRNVTEQREFEDLVDRVLSHYQQYYDEKEKIALADASVLFSPPWLTSLECAFLWMGGFKPGLVVKIALASVGVEMNVDQARRMDGVKVWTRMKEKEMNEEMAFFQETLASPPFLEAARRCAKSKSKSMPPQDKEVNEAMRTGLENAVSSADLMRMGTVLKVMEILSPGQRVKFLAAATRLQLKIRSWGLIPKRC